MPAPSAVGTEAIPVAPDHSAPRNSAPAPPSSGAVPDPHSARLLLICSDHKLASELAREAQAIGFDCDICDLPQALPYLQSSAYDAAVLDVVTPDSDFAVIEEARRATKSRQVPIVALAHPTDLNSAFRAGASFALARPVSSDLLANTLGAIYRIAEGRRRQYARYRVEMPLTLTVQGQTMDAKATDLGHGGMALVTSEPLDPGGNVSVRFALPGSEDQIIAVGEIRWSDHHGRSGLCFNSIAGCGRAALDNWIARRHAGISDPLPQPPAPPVQPPLITSSEAAADAARNTMKSALSLILALFCLFVIGFWIYLAMTS